MTRSRTPLVILLLMSLALPAGCASSSGGEGDEAADTFEEQVGRVLFGLLREGMDKILPKYRLAVRRAEEQYATLYYETEWQERVVTPEEEARGVVEARQRAIIRGRRVGQTLDGEGEFRVTLTAENQVRTETDPSWHPTPAPPSFFEHWRTVYSDLRLEVQTGVRR